MAENYGRPIGVAVRENTTAVEVYDLYERAMEDEHISPAEDRLIRDAMERNCDASQITEEALRVGIHVLICGIRGRRAKALLRGWDVIEGGLGQEPEPAGPAVARRAA